MNCCNEFGQCTRGPNCPAREAPPEQTPTQLRKDWLAVRGLWVMSSIVTLTIISAAYLIFGG